MARDPERVARFEREAKLLAALNHPQIASIYGFDQADDRQLLVLELVEGPTLADRIASGPLPIEECLEVGRQIAGALEAAHEKGIIHRDLKPNNVKLTTEGQAKVLDFGLAKALVDEAPDADPGDSPTISREFTQPGVILGTAAYMSPEQARGQRVDKRSDIWSFGCVLFECLSGTRVFAGESVTDSLGAILHKEPDWDRLPTDTPMEVRLLLRSCLAKKRKRRLHDIADARVALEDAIANPTVSEQRLDQKDVKVASRQRMQIVVAVLVAAVILAIIATVTTLNPMPVQRPSETSKLVKLKPLLEGLARNRSVTISPDGRSVVYIRDDQLWIQDLDELTPRALPGTEGARKPFWSPNSEWVAYFGRRSLWKAPAESGKPVEITQYPAPFKLSYVHGGGAWTSDGKITFGGGSYDHNGLLDVSHQGGNTESVLNPEPGEREFQDPSPLPNARGILFVSQSLTSTGDSLCVLSKGQRRVIFRHDSSPISTPVYAPSGHILYTEWTPTPVIWAMPFSLDSLEAGGAPFRVASGHCPSVSMDGTLCYLDGNPTDGLNKSLIWINHDGHAEPIATREHRQINSISLSDDETKVLVSAADSDKQGEEQAYSIWSHDLVRGVALPITFPPQGFSDFFPRWHPDGVHFVFVRSPYVDTSRPDAERVLMKKRIDGTGTAEPIARGNWSYNFSLSPDAKYVVFAFRNVDRGDVDLGYILLEEGAHPITMRDTTFIEWDPSIAPSGQLLAYRSNESGRDEVYLTRFPSGEGRWPVSLSGGIYPFWTAGDAEDTLFYLSSGELHRVTVRTEREGDPFIGPAERLFSYNDLRVNGRGRIQATRDGKRFLAVQAGDEAAEADRNREDGPQPVLIQNWLNEFASQ